MSGSRQQPGLACEECRKKKLRCDRRRPQCNQCEDSGTACYVNEVRSPRGPKKGHLKALRNRIATLESIISCDQAHAEKPSLETQDYIPVVEISQILSTTQEYGINSTMPEANLSSSFEESPGGITPNTPPDQETGNTDIIEADLDQLYFDRVHPIAPMLHQARYFCWSQKSNKPDPHVCLQLAMWTMAAAGSAHLQHMRESLYKRARTKLEALDNDIETANAASLQAAQAWLLVTHYEFRYMGYRRAWLTAGRAFRIIQLAKLHEVDRLNDVEVTLSLPDLWTEAEEKRRTYWLAYCLDRFLNITYEWSLSLNEEALYTYLPASEADFQHGRPAVTTLLYDAMEESGTKMLPTFAETIVLTTLCWHSVTFHRVTPDTDTSPNPSSVFWKRHSRLYQMVQQRLMLLSLPASAPELHDPMRLFTNMLANSAVIWFHNIIEAVQIDINEQMLLVPLYSAYEIVTLAKPLVRSSYFKAHPFSPMLLYLSAKFLKSHSDCGSVSEDNQKRLEELKKALRVLQGGNNLATKYLELLESDGSHKLCNVSPLGGSILDETEQPFFLDILNFF